MEQAIKCAACGRGTISQNGFIRGVTLHKHPTDPTKYLCSRHMPDEMLPNRIKNPNEFRALLSKLKGSSRKKKKKIINKLRKSKI